MIPGSTSVLMVLLKPLHVFSAMQCLLGLGPRKGNSNESVKAKL